MDYNKKKVDNQKINPKQKAVALSYHADKDVAPRVVAKGQGYVAQKILEHGEMADVPVFEDADLTEELTRLDLGENIPPELYEVVAQVLAFISNLDKYEEIRQRAKK